MRTVASFAIHFTRFINPDGDLAAPLPDFAHNKDLLSAMYRGMVLTRAFDTKAVALQRTGRLGTYASCLGQEACAIGLGAAMQKNDIFAPSFREHGTQLWRGVTMEELFLFWGGDERGNDFSGPKRDFPDCVPVGTHATHALGAAMALKLRGEKQAAVCSFGDGATSKGDVYEAMNMAGVFKAPIIFFIQNNQWAISVPRDGQSACETLAQKAIAAGLDGEQVDGNDILAVYHVVDKALQKARNGNGGALIEALTYRLGDHTTADDASRYRKQECVAPHWKEDPIARMRSFLVEHHGWGKKDEEAVIDETNAKVKAAVDAYLAIAPQPPEAIFDYLYAELPGDLVRQRQHLMAGGQDND